MKIEKKERVVLVKAGMLGSYIDCKTQFQK